MSLLQWDGAWVAALVALLSGCGADAPSSSSRQTGSGGSGESSNVDTDASAGSSGSAVAGAGGTSGGFMVNGKEAGVKPLGDAACSGASFNAEHVTIPHEVTKILPVAVYIMLDQSASMLELSSSGLQSKWDLVRDGISAFVDDPSSSGLDVGLNMFPPPGNLTACIPGLADCTGADYATPVVPIGALPANPAPIKNALPVTPGGLCTPTEPALRAAEDACRAYHQQHMDEKCIVVFVTDGVPNGCSNVASVLSGIAATAFQQDGTLTFAVGMAVPFDDGGVGASEIDFTLLNAIAKAGGTDCNPQNPGNEACNIGGGSALSTALAQIRQTVTETVTTTETTPVACQWKIPEPLDGGTVDPKKVNLSFTTAGNSQDLGNVAGSGSCSGVRDAWYYDDATPPTSILVCPDTCTMIQAANDGRIDIAFGCETHTAVPK